MFEWRHQDNKMGIEVENVRPLEEVDPELAEMFQKIVRREHGWNFVIRNDNVYDRKTGGLVSVGDKIGRNDPCTCGSGKKYKKCCGKK